MFGTNSDLSLLTNKKQPPPSFDGNFTNDIVPTYTNDVCILKDFVNKDLCSRILDFFKFRTDWEKSVTHGEARGEQSAKDSPRQSSQISLNPFKEVDEAVYKVFNQAIGKIGSEFINIGVTDDEGYSILRYQPGGEYKPHVDCGQKNGRIVSGLLYLNNDFVGGQLHFVRQNLTITPEPGMVVLFPSCYTHIHASLPIQLGTKYSIVTWYR